MKKITDNDLLQMHWVHVQSTVPVCNMVLNCNFVKRCPWFYILHMSAGLSYAGPGLIINKKEGN